jgi:hypothetical protein
MNGRLPDGQRSKSILPVREMTSIKARQYEMSVHLLSEFKTITDAWHGILHRKAERLESEEEGTRRITVSLLSPWECYLSACL